MYIYSYQGRHSVRISEKYGIQKGEDHMEVVKHMHSYIRIHTRSIIQSGNVINVQLASTNRQAY